MARLLDAEKVDLGVEQVYRLGEVVKSNDAERLKQFIKNLTMQELRAMIGVAQYISLVVNYRSTP